MSLTVSSSSVLTLGGGLLFSLLLGSLLSSFLLLLLGLGFSGFSFSIASVVSSLLSASDISLDDFVGLDLKIAVDLGGKIFTESLLDHLIGFNVDGNLNEGNGTLSVLISDYLGTQSNLFSLSSSCTLSEIPLTGPL